MADHNNNIPAPLLHLGPPKTRPAPRRAWRAAVAIPLCLLTAMPARTGENEQTSPAPPTTQQFDASFIRGRKGQTIDLSRFAYGNTVLPGSYRLDVYVNEQAAGRQNIRVDSDENGNPRYCVNGAQLTQWGLAVERLPDPDAFRQQTEAGGCVDYQRLIPQANVAVDMAALRVDVSIPQLYLSHVSRDYIDPANWDSGITAGYLGYNANMYYSDSSGRTSRQYFTTLQAGLNFGGWRLRHNASYNITRQAGAPSNSHYEAISSYLQRDVTALKSQLTLGEYFTPNELFDSIPFTGVQLGSDDRMLPESMRGFAPAIRGTAETNAKVTVRQGSQIVYETTVAPGPFEITDLYSTGYAGDMVVTVTEADGRSKSFTVPYASVAQLLRPGVSRYNVTVGRYRDNNYDDEPRFVLGTWQRGISNLLTGYAGGIAADKYQALQGGVALNTPAGAIALDVTQSRASDLPGTEKRNRSGRSYRLSYSKMLDATRTSFSFAAYRFSSKDYLSFADFVGYRNTDANALLRQRNRLQVSFDQQLGERGGSLYLSGSWQNYWGGEKNNDVTYQAGYANNFERLSYSFGIGRTRTETGGYDTRYSLTLSIPFGYSAYAPRLNSSMNHSDDNTMMQASLSGTAGEHGQASYSVFGSRNRNRDSGQTQNSFGASGQYRSRYATLNAGFSRSTDYKQFNLGADGMVVMHPGGVNFSQQNGETIAIVEAPDAAGAGIFNQSGARVAGNGYGVVAGLTPYRRNDVSLDPQGMSENAELQVTSQQTTPRYGAIVLLKYPTTSGHPMLFRAVDKHGDKLPIGAEVRDENGQPLTMVGQGGLVFVRPQQPQGRLDIVWGDLPTQRCELHYAQPEATASNGEKPQHLIPVETVCQAPAEAALQHAAAPETPPQTVAEDDTETNGAALSDNDGPASGSGHDIAAVPQFTPPASRAVLFSAVDEYGEALPFGADVRDEYGQSMTTVGQRGRIFVRLRQPQGRLEVAWGAPPVQHCELRYALPETAPDDGGNRHPQAVAAVCRASGEAVSQAVAAETAPSAVKLSPLADATATAQRGLHPLPDDTTEAGAGAKQSVPTLADDADAADERSLRDAIERWRKDWQSTDTERYLAHYDHDFRSDRQDYNGWVAHKRKVGANRGSALVGIEKLAMFRQPGNDEIIAVTFEQTFRSKAYADKMSKRQYWRRADDGQWKIVFEADASATPKLPPATKTAQRGHGLRPLPSPLPNDVTETNVGWAKQSVPTPPDDADAVDERSLNDAIERWRKDWQSTDTERYLAHYDHDFRSDRQDYKAWVAHKRKVGANRGSASIGIEKLAMFRQPGNAEVFVVTFEQTFKSKAYADRMRKRQFWKRADDGQWKIVFEAAA